MDTKVSDAHMFKYIEEKEDEGGVAFDSDNSETPMYEMAQEDINAILVDGYDGYDDQESEPDKKQALGMILNGQYIKKVGIGME